MITFTYWNAGWFSSMTSNYYVEHAKVDMPDWTLLELKVLANDALELHLIEQELQMRFPLFGGTARFFTLETATDFVNTGTRVIDIERSTASTMDEMQRCFAFKRETQSLWHS
jgi:hypothetical protein